MSGKKKAYGVSDRVFAKVRGFPAWPARITGVAGSRYKVVFYGTYETATLKKEDIWEYNEATKAKFGKGNQKRKGFGEGMYEIEHIPDIRINPPGQEEAEKAQVVEEEEKEEGGEGEGEKPAEKPEEDETENVKEQEQEEENALVINETKGRRGNKRKANEETETPPPSKRRPETVSRSGRVIKPKKFVDEEKAESVKSPLKTKKEPRKMWVEVKSTGDMIEINLDRDKPASFESKDAELQWERATARNALEFKERVESGDFIPDEVRVKLEEKTERTEEEERILKRARQISLKMEKIRWLKIERRLVDIDAELKTACNARDPDAERCLVSLTELHSMAVAPLMLKKRPDVVATVKKLRRYAGARDSERVAPAESEKIRDKADAVYSKFKSIFDLPEEAAFDDAFKEQVRDFNNAVKELDEDVLTLVSDPVKKAKKKKKD